MPGVFKQQNHIDEIKGVYVPFWIFDLKAKADFSYHAEKTRVWVSNDIEYTEHENFEVKRAGTVEFEKVPADGSKKMDEMCIRDSRRMTRSTSMEHSYR